MKTKAFLKIFILILVSVSLISCKRGENDPFLSIKSRDARISGKWILSSLSETRIEVNNNGGNVVSETTTIAFENGIMATVFPNGDVVNIPYSFEMTINKNGTFSSVEIIDGVKKEQEGYWWWLDDTKTKTKIAFSNDAGMFLIDQLKDKELILIRDEYIKNTSPDNIFAETIIKSTIKYKKR